MDNIQKYKQAVKKQRQAAKQLLGQGTANAVASTMPYSGDDMSDIQLNFRRFNDVKLNKRRIQKLRKLMGTDVAVSQIQRSVHPLMDDMYNNAFYMGLDPQIAAQVDPQALKKHIQYPFYFKDYQQWDKQTDQQLMNNGTVVLGGRSGLGTLAHQLGHAKDRQQNPDDFFAQHKQLNDAKGAVAKGLAIGGGIGLAGSLALLIGGLSTNNEIMAALAGIPLIVGLTGGGVVGAAKSNQHMQNAYKARKQNQLRASRYAMEALSKMRLKPNQIQAIQDKLNTALKTYGVQEQV